MKRILVADKIAEPGLDVLRAADGVEFDVRHGLSPEELAECIGEFDGMMIRSGVKVTADVLKNPGKLAAVARAGVGVDNVDLDAATKAGVLVLNTPDANTLSTAELTMAMMLALHRRIPAAHAHVIAGGWSRGDYQGDQLAGKTLGVVGYGRIGRAVAERALALEMKIIAFDPFVSPGAGGDRVQLTNDLDVLLAAADCITLHASLSEGTKHLIGAGEIAKMKDGAKIVNCARGKLISESALVEALRSGKLSGAALDVYESEPPEGSPLLSLPNVVLTPHLGASTVEAQARVSIDAAEALLAYLQRGEIRSAVNVSGMPASLSAREKSFVDLGARMGALLSPWCSGGVDRVEVTAFGDSLTGVVSTVAWQACISVVGPHLDDRMNLVNAREIAAGRGITVEHSVDTERSGRPDSVRVKVHTRGETHDIEGTVLADGKPRILAIDGYVMEMVPELCMTLIFNDDRPGVIGLVGQSVGDAKINIADMALSRRGNKALMVLKLDQDMPAELRDELRSKNPPILSLKSVTLPPIPQA